MSANPLLDAVPLDHDLSPATGWTRDHWVAAADDLLLAVRPWATPEFARIDLPGEPARAGWVSDGLEGFARTFLTAAFRVAGAGGDDPHGHLRNYRRGLVAGTATPGADDAESWPVIGSVRGQGQPMVESASIALSLDLTREWLWDSLSDGEQDAVEAWLREALRHEPAPNNWYLFPLTVASFLTGVGRGDAETAAAVDRGLALLDGWYLGQGWYTDGDGRAVDHYVGWALHLYPVLCARLRGDTALGGRLGVRLREFLGTFSRTFDGDGAPLHQGRSLTYRAAAVSSVALGAVTGDTPLSPGASRRLLSAGLRHFLDHGANAPDGLFSRGWHGPHPATVQAYSGPASPYWVSKAFAALLAGPGHALWTAREEPVPALDPDATTPVPPVGWLVHGTADGLVRVLDHGAHGGGADPLYARLAYSTRTGPTSARNVPDNSVVLTVRGLAGVRDDREPLGTGPDWAASRHHPRFAGTDLPQAQVLTLALARGPWEVRVHRFHAVPVGTPVALTGWALAADHPGALRTHVGPGAVRVEVEGLVTRFEVLAGAVEADVVRAPAGTAFGAWALVPRFRGVVERSPIVTALALSPTDPGPAPRVVVAGEGVAGEGVAAQGLSVHWPDGAVRRVDLSGDVPRVSAGAAGPSRCCGEGPPGMV